MCILLCKSTRYDLTGYISLVIKLNILNHMMILAFVDYSYSAPIELCMRVAGDSSCEPEADNTDQSTE